MGAAARNSSGSASAAGSSKERPRPAIIGGQPAQKDRFPWAAQLRINDKSNLWPQFCGASLVHRQVLLTAAHVSSRGRGRFRGCESKEWQWLLFSWDQPDWRAGARQRNDHIASKRGAHLIRCICSPPHRRLPAPPTVGSVSSTTTLLGSGSRWRCRSRRWAAGPSMSGSEGLVMHQYAPGLVGAMLACCLPAALGHVPSRQHPGAGGCKT